MRCSELLQVLDFMTSRSLSHIDALLITVLLLGLVGGAIALFGNDSLSGPTQVALFLTGMCTAFIGLKNGVKWQAIESSIRSTVDQAIIPLLVFLAVGCLIAALMLSGAVPTLLYAGLGLFNPALFYPLACILTALVALATGSSWTTAATIGVALIGVSIGFDLSPAVTAGAVISGAYFGDKMSPLSETTNLASAVSNSDLIDHIKHMTWVSGPSFIIALILFTIINLSDASALGSQDRIDEIRASLSALFNLNPLTLAPVALLLYLSAKNLPALLTIVLSTVLAIVVAFIFQAEMIEITIGATQSEGTITMLWQILATGFVLNSGVEVLDELLSRGGMESMVNMLWLVVCSMTMTGVLKAVGYIQYLLDAIVKFIHTTRGLVAATIGSSISVNALTGDQYLSIVLPGQMWREEYKNRNLASKNLSRALEDGGTLTSPLIPWNACAVFMAGTLGVATLDYLPFVFFCLINPVLAILMASWNIGIAKADVTEATPAQAQ